MNNEKDSYNTTRYKKLNIGLKEESIDFDSSSKTTPVVKKARPSYPRQTHPQVVERSSPPSQSRSIEDRVTVQKSSGSNNNQNSQMYSRTSSRARTTRPAEARPTTPSRANPTMPSKARPTQARTSAPSKADPRMARTGSGNPNVNRSYAQNYQRRPDSQRINDVPNERNSKKKSLGKKASGLTAFKKFLIIYSAALLAIVIIGMVVLSSFVKTYETNQPTNLAASIASDLSSDPKKYLGNHKDLISCLENVDAVIDKVSETMSGNKVSFIENKEYRAENPSYDFTIDDNIVAKVEFEKANKAAFGLTTWKVKSLNVVDYIQGALSYTLYAPVGVKVLVNDKEVNDTFLIAAEAIPEHLQTAAKFTTIPNYNTYKISGFTQTPTVTATDEAGTAINVSIANDIIVVGASTTQEFKDQVTPMVDDCIVQWSNHFINLYDHLNRYIYDNCDWHAYIYGSDEIYPIQTSIYESDSIVSVEFTEKEISNIVKYTDKCFTVDVKYHLQVNFNSDRFHDDNQKLDATWVWVYFDEWNEWLIVDNIYK